MNPGLAVFENDPFGYLDDLRDCWADPAGPENAYRLALAQGRCFLFGVAPGEEMGRPLPVELALTAAAELARRLPDWSAEADRLGERWDAAIDPAEGDEYCARLLKFRMDVWACHLSLSRASRATSQEAFHRALGVIAEQADRFDLALEAQADVLSTLTGTHLLDNYRADLAPEYREDLPWWLDGSLEEVARRLTDHADRTLPGPKTWAEVRHQAGKNGPR